MKDTPVGFIGLGRMGVGMARNLSKSGVPLWVHDVNPTAAEALGETNISAVTPPTELAERAQLVFVCVPSETESDSVLFGEHGITTNIDGLTIVDLTTMNRGAAITLSQRAQDAGCTYFDCPISGKPFRADAGTLTIMFGGTDEGFAYAKPYLDVMGECVVHCGEVGSGQLMKALNNIVYDVNIAAICEIMPLAVKAGLEPTTLARVLTTASGRSFASEYFAQRILDREFEGDFTLRGAYKDIVNFKAVAAQLGASLPVVNAMIATYEATINEGYGDQPKSAMIKRYEAQLKQEVRRHENPNKHAS